jgi:N-formylglutamate amidohydrolase
MVKNGPSFVRIGPVIPDIPIILSVPHAGRNYHPSMMDMCKPNLSQLAILEDRHADALVTKATDAGFSALVAQTPRLWIDLNRAEDDLDPSQLDYPLYVGKPISSKARGGLGLVPTRTQGLGQIWRQKLSRDDIEHRITHHHRPYHTALREMIEATAARFGGAVLIDVHSMPSLSHMDCAPDIVVGDRFGRSASHWVSDVISTIAARDYGYKTASNSPYAGGHILDQHGAPYRNIHAVQIEVDRALYLDRFSINQIAEISKIQSLILNITESITSHFLRNFTGIAAE